MRLGGAGIQENAQEKREKASPVFSCFRSCLWTLCICSIFCLFMDFSFVYFSVVLGSLWRVIWTVFVDNLGAEEVLESLIWLGLWISGLDLKSPLRMERRRKLPFVHSSSFFFLWFWGFSLLFVVVVGSEEAKS